MIKNRITQELKNRMLQDIKETIKGEKEVPEIKQFHLLDNLAQSLERQKINLKPDNPFLKVKGEYTFDIDTSKSGSEKLSTYTIK